MHALLQADKDILTPDGISNRAREVKAQRVMVQTAEGALQVFDVPASRHDKFKTDLQTFGTPERVVFLDGNGMRLSELAAIAAAAEAQAASQQSVNLLSFQQFGQILNGATKAQLTAFADIATATIRANGETAAALRQTLQSQATELDRTRTELRMARRQLDQLRDESHKLQIALQAAADKPESEKKEALGKAWERFSEKCAELFFLAVGEHVELGDGDESK